MSTILTVIGGGLAGSAVTYCLTVLRENRRTADTFRAPQRVAIGNISEAAYKLTQRAYALRNALDGAANDTRGRADHLGACAIRAVARGGPARGALIRFGRTNRGLRDDKEQVPVGQTEFDEALQALFDLIQVFQIGRLSIVDAQCFEAMGEAWRNIADAGTALSDVGDELPSADKLRKRADAFVLLVDGLNHDVYELVAKGRERVSPRDSLWKMLINRRARKELDVRYFNT